MASTPTRIRLGHVRRPGGTTLPLCVAGVLASAGFVLAVGAPVAWLWLAICAFATIPVVVWFAARGRIFEPLPVLTLACGLLFVARPLQLILEWRDLYSFLPARNPLQSLTLLEAGETALFVTTKLTEPLETAMARALGACALFLVLLLVGYWLGAGRLLAKRLSALRGAAGSIDLVAAVAVPLAIGLAAQVAIIARAGGPTASLESASEQTALSESFVLFFLAGFAFAAVLIWVAWRRPASRLEWTALVLSVVAVCGFSILAGSRTRVFDTLIAIALIVHYLRRRWRPRELVAGALVLLAFAGSYVVFRNEAGDESLGRSARVASEHVLDGRVVLNDVTSFDYVLFATTIYGRSRSHERGRFLLNSARSFVPRAIDPNKPEGGDIVFRRAVWGERFGAGRPPTAVGDLYIDFGFPGVAVGALLIGIAIRGVLGLLRGGDAGRSYRVALYTIMLVILYELITGTFTTALGFTLTLLVPFLIAVHGFGRLGRRRLGLGRLGSGRG